MVEWRGDRKTSFFHDSVKKRRAQNKILSLIDEQETEKFEEGSKGNIAVDYFQKLFSTSNMDNAVDVLDGLPLQVSNAVKWELIKPLSKEEIK